jgi:hypothetical protein
MVRAAGAARDSFEFSTTSGMESGSAASRRADFLMMGGDMSLVDDTMDDDISELDKSSVQLQEEEEQSVVYEKPSEPRYPKIYRTKRLGFLESKMVEHTRNGICTSIVQI